MKKKSFKTTGDKLMQLTAAATFALLAFTASACAFGPKHEGSGHPVPQSVAEAKMHMATATQRAVYPTPPGNVRAEDMRALFGDTVMISFFNTRYVGWRFWEQGSDVQIRKGQGHGAHMKIIFIGRDGRYAWCARDRYTKKYFWRDDRWEPEKAAYKGKVYPLFEPLAGDPRPGLSPLYDARTGEMFWYGEYKGRWWDHDIGHLQQRLPAAVYTLCPDFPRPQELGIGVNKAQTALTYREMLAQHPGTRVLRPDLITSGDLSKPEAAATAGGGE